VNDIFFISADVLGCIRDRVRWFGLFIRDWFCGFQLVRAKKAMLYEVCFGGS